MIFCIEYMVLATYYYRLINTHWMMWSTFPWSISHKISLYPFSAGLPRQPRIGCGCDPKSTMAARIPNSTADVNSRPPWKPSSHMPGFWFICHMFKPTIRRRLKKNGSGSGMLTKTKMVSKGRWCNNTSLIKCQSVHQEWGYRHVSNTPEGMQFVPWLFFFLTIKPVCCKQEYQNINIMCIVLAIVSFKIIHLHHMNSKLPLVWWWLGQTSWFGCPTYLWFNTNLLIWCLLREPSHLKDCK